MWSIVSTIFPRMQRWRRFLSVDAIRPTPILAGGGIVDGSGVVAGLALGAIGAWLGTVVVIIEESCLECIE
jgi:NAD(P)H-dependent flavin oxidoreductase YrpB (nitropropane dioxygenase family)